MDGKIERKGEGDNNEVDEADCNSGSSTGGEVCFNMEKCSPI
jgi:hypothetical protein